MSRSADVDAIVYIERRIRYYKKRKPVVRSLTKQKHLIQRFGKRQLNKMTKNRLEEIDRRIVEYSLALKILSRHKKKLKPQS